MKKIVIASDSFKGSLTSIEVADSVAKGLLQISHDLSIVKVNVADGGEGTVDAIIEALNGIKISVSVENPIGKPICASYGIADDIAIIEMSAASGLTLLAEEERNPMHTSTHGTGQLILDAIKRGCRRFLIGIGGSATNDAGTGMLQALGYRFFDHNQNHISRCCGATMHDVASIDDSQVPKSIKQSQFTIACDVDTPFCGKDGAAYVFAPQKGADEAMVEHLDRGMHSLAKVIFDKYQIDVIPIAGAGAAGGMGGAFKAFLNASLKRGIDMVLDTIHFDEIIADASLVITGEGKIDHQTAKGKTPTGILRRAQKCGVPVVAIGGKVEMCDELSQMGFVGVYEVSDRNLPLEQAMLPHIASASITSFVTKYLPHLIKNLS